MFGEDTIYGQRIIKKDSKGRIFLPSFTYCEDGDSLLVLKNEIDNLFEIYSEAEINRIISEIELKIQNSNNKEEINYCNKFLLIIYQTILKKVKCDSQHRINISDVYPEESKLKIIGSKNHIKLLPTKE